MVSPNQRDHFFALWAPFTGLCPGRPAIYRGCSRPTTDILSSAPFMGLLILTRASARSTRSIWATPASRFAAPTSPPLQYPSAATRSSPSGHSPGPSRPRNRSRGPHHGQRRFFTGDSCFASIEIDKNSCRVCILSSGHTGALPRMLDVGPPDARDSRRTWR